MVQMSHKSKLPSASVQHAIKEYEKSVKSMFSSLDDGVISPSAYETAWVALVQDVNGGPRFPSTLQWIVNHQFPDGSWGDPLLFSVFDRLLNTLACVVALTSWNMHPDKCKKGMKFVEENINKIGGDQKDEHKTSGFDVLFTALVDLAQKLKIKLPNDSRPVLKEMYTRRDLSLTMIPKDKFHSTPTVMLNKVEGMKDLDWEKLLKLRSEDGSFLYSPASTAFAFMQTKDQKCLEYLNNVVAKFNGGVPTIYPLDLFEQIWMVDHLQRLGIGRYFHKEIKDVAHYIYRNWDEQGIGITRNCNIPDLDDTAMAFQFLRTNGYRISPDVFQIFENDGKFWCYEGMPGVPVTVMCNLYRASQLLFPGEKILNDAKNFSSKFLTTKRLANELHDKWIITKDLPGEVGYVLDVPWYANLPRLEARYYLEHYGGEDDVWIGKTLFRLGNINNNKYLEMAKLDYNHCQAVHQLEWSHIQKWYADLKIDQESLNTKLLWSYYGAAASIYEPERSNERVAWAKTSIILQTITSLGTPIFSNVDAQAFVNEFTNTQHHDTDGKPWHMVTNALHETLNQISSDTQMAHGTDIRPHLYRVWKAWLLKWQKGVDVVKGEAELIIRTISMSSGHSLSEELLSHPQYLRLSSITNDIFHEIFHKEDRTISLGIDSKMQELVQLVLSDSPDDLDLNLKQMFLTVAKTFYYRAYMDPETINHHINKVLFEKVI